MSYFAQTEYPIVYLDTKKVVSRGELHKEKPQRGRAHQVSHGDRCDYSPAGGNQVKGNVYRVGEGSGDDLFNAHVMQCFAKDCIGYSAGMEKLLQTP